METKPADEPTRGPIGEPAGDPIGPLREPLMPQISIRSQIALITVSAFLMVVAQQAVFHERLWAILILVGLAQLVAVFSLYALSFCMANLFSKISSAAMTPLPDETRYTPTLTMPPEWSANPPAQAAGQTTETLATENHTNAAFDETSRQDTES
ncbi:hypothetical protein [Stieleria varia]|uniref:Transmembrane protein n=1 Tax=Stieleria varia TaxID=2528005 RepID=A0A5C6B111_9BACT|nr:hypothetical protein [Stieleria varia]TWU05598.1 hypothetical protein Pla52n_13130 [Stieleria varia]